MTQAEWLILLAVLLFMVSLPFTVLLIAKLWGYGTARGKYNFEKEQKEKDNGSARR